MIAVTLNAPNDWQDHTDLLNDGFHTYQMLSVNVPDQEIAVQNGQSLLQAAAREPVKILVKKQEESLYHMEIQWKEPLKAPIRENQAVGKALVYRGNDVVQKTLLLARNRVEPLVLKPHYLEILRKFFCGMQQSG